MKNRRGLALLCSVLLASTATMVTVASAQEAGSTSAAAVRELTALLGEQKLEAIATADPEHPDRFIAALYYPGAQLLVVSAAYPVPEQLRQRLAERQFREAYTDLQGAGVREGKLFVMDLGADGLHANREAGEPFDIVYVNGEQSIAYDNDPKAQKVSASEYAQRFKADDARYARILRALAAAARQLPTT